MFYAEIRVNWTIIGCYYNIQIIVFNSSACSMAQTNERLATKPEVPVSKPPDTKIYFDAKPISNFKNSLEKGEHDEENDNDES